jgi:hypothetical protein
MQHAVVMPSIQVRDVPLSLYRRVKKLAESERRSIAQQVIVLIERALNYEQERKDFEKLIDRIRQNADHYQHLPDPVSLIREDRER